MLFELAIRRTIKVCEVFLIITVYFFYTLSYTETMLKTSVILMPIYLYILTLSFYYYNVVLKKSPGSLNSYNCLEVRSICYKCNRLKNNRTFHCDSCNKCYYKRDHHCPWIGKCVAEGNYKDFYLFVFFMVLYLGLRLFRSGSYDNISFISNYMFLILLTFFAYINFLLCSDITSVEYTQSFFKMNYFKPKEVCSIKQIKYLHEKVKMHILDNDNNSIVYILMPFIRQRACILDS